MAVYGRNEGPIDPPDFDQPRQSMIGRSSTRRLMTIASIALTYAPLQPGSPPNMGARERLKEPGDFSAGLLETSR
jgi:hypothetical protein